MKVVNRWSVIFLLLAVTGAVVANLYSSSWNTALDIIYRKAGGRQYSIEDRIKMHGDSARASLLPAFAAAGIDYPPKSVSIVGLKLERRLEIYGADDRSGPKLIRNYPILKASGKPGPKLHEGDRQVPEGIYRIESLNPNSQFHLSLRVNYPNEYDRERARIDGRSNLGGDIMIHGSQVSIGCLAIGDAAVEELFVLAADTGLARIELILSPRDFRQTDISAADTYGTPPWVPELYRKIRGELIELPSLE